MHFTAHSYALTLPSLSYTLPFSQILPVLREHRDEFLLKELVKRWENHKVMIRWLSRFFMYLDRYYISRHNLHTLKEVGLLTFRGAAEKGVQGGLECFKSSTAADAAVAVSNLVGLC